MTQREVSVWFNVVENSGCTIHDWLHLVLDKWNEKGKKEEKDGCQRRFEMSFYWRHLVSHRGICASAAHGAAARQGPAFSPSSTPPMCYIAALHRCVTPLRYTTAVHSCVTPLRYTTALRCAIATPQCFTLLYWAVPQRKPKTFGHQLIRAANT